MKITTYPPTREVVLYGDTAARVAEHIEIKQKLAKTASEALTESLKLTEQNKELKTTVAEMNAVRTNMIRDYDALREKLERCMNLIRHLDPLGVYAKTLQETQP